MDKLNLRRADYDSKVARTKVFIPAFPTGINPLAYGKGGTTTTAYCGIGDQVKNVRDVNTAHFVAPTLQASGDEHCLSWKVPDDFYDGDDTFVWLLWTPLGPTTTTVRFSYDLHYNASKVVDYAQKASTHATLTGEAITEAATALDTDLDEQVCFDGLTTYGTYRSMRGKISATKLKTEDLVTFKIEADAAPISNGVLGIVGLEIDYARRLRSNLTEDYK